MMPWSSGWYHDVEVGGSHIIKVFDNCVLTSSYAVRCNEKLSHNKATCRPVIFWSNQRSHSLKTAVVIQLFRLLRHLQPKFSGLTPAAWKTWGFLAAPINYRGRRSEASELQQKCILIRALSFLHPESERVERPRSGGILQYKPVSSQLKISRGA